MFKFLCFAAFVAGIAASQQSDSNDLPLDERIMGGHDAVLGQFPHQVALEYDYDFFCGGAIISWRFILTAAQCVAGFTDVTEIYITDGYRTDSVASHKLESAIVHPDYNKQTGANDIAILRTATLIEFTKTSRPIALPTTDVPVDGNFSAIVSGWGQFEDFPSDPPLRGYSGNAPPERHPELPRILQWRETKTQKKAICLRTQPTHDDQICTEGGTCIGDLGSPLITRGPEPVLVGIAAGILRKSKCELSRHQPDVYSNVFLHLQFIRNAMRTLSKE